MNSKKYCSANKKRYLKKSFNIPLGFANKQANGEGDKSKQFWNEEYNNY